MEIFQTAQSMGHGQQTPEELKVLAESQAAVCRCYVTNRYEILSIKLFNILLFYSLALKIRDFCIDYCTMAYFQYLKHKKYS